jgi:prepilin-type N-terminal cleavage/methylation domain-containing protein
MQENRLQGMTLIEILTTISIIVLLTNIVIVMLVQVKIKARDTIRVRDLKELQKALDIYWQDAGKYPLTDPTQGWLGLCGAAPWGTPKADWIPGLVASGTIGKLPVDPLTNATRCYLYKSDSFNYKLIARGENMTNTQFLLYVDPARDGGIDPNVVEITGNQQTWAIYTFGAKAW